MSKLAEGMPAPHIISTDHAGNKFDLKDYSGNRIVLFFYPKDNTPGCTAEACSLRDNYDLLKKKGFLIFGVSPDTVKSHHRFIEKHNLPFPLIMDENKEIMESYGVWGEKKLYGRSYMGVIRTTFIISCDGLIEKIIEKVNTKSHGEQILNELGISI